MRSEFAQDVLDVRPHRGPAGPVALGDGAGSQSFLERSEDFHLASRQTLDVRRVARLSLRGVDSPRDLFDHGRMQKRLAAISAIDQRNQVTK